MAAVELGGGVCHLQVAAIEINPPLQVVQLIGSQGQLVNCQVAAGLEGFRRSTHRGMRTQERKHAVDERLTPAGVERAVQIRRREMIGRKDKLPAAVRVAAVQGASPVSAKGLRGRKLD